LNQTLSTDIYQHVSIITYHQKINIFLNNFTNCPFLYYAFLVITTETL